MISRMATIISFPATTIPGLIELGVTELYAEVDDSGNVTRELGMARDGAIAHRHPGTPPVARHGLFDLQRIEGAGPSDMQQDDFDALFKGAG